MYDEIRGSAGLVVCENCAQSRFDIPADESGDPLIKCRCGIILGPIFSLRAFSNEEAHTIVRAKIKQG